MSKAKINYLYHDGFIMETDSHILIFDYFNDHFNSLIFEWKNTNPNIKYILSSDIEIKDISPGHYGYSL